MNERLNRSLITLNHRKFEIEPNLRLFEFNIASLRKYESPIEIIICANVPFLNIWKVDQNHLLIIIFDKVKVHFLKIYLNRFVLNVLNFHEIGERTKFDFLLPYFGKVYFIALFIYIFQHIL